MADPTLSVIVRSREGLVYEGPAWAVTSTNRIGPFDVLPLHANFVCVLNQMLTLHIPGGSPRILEVPRGILKVKDNIVEIFVGV